MHIEINSYTIDILRSLACDLTNTSEIILDKTSYIKSVLHKNEDAYKNFSGRLDNLLDSISYSAAEARTPVESIAKIINEIADAYEEVMMG